MIKGKRIFITGGQGFIGTALCKTLSKNNKIMTFDNLRRNSFQYFQKDINKKNIQSVVGDILDKEFLKKTVNDFRPDIVLHLAAMAGVSDYYKQPVKTMEVNAIGTYSVLEAIKNLNLERLVDFSTSEVYGPMAFGAKEDGATAQGQLKQRRWTYGISKLAGEGLTFAYAAQYGIPVTSVRPFNIYGPGQVGEGAIQIFIRRAINNQEIQITGDGNQIRAWCYIDDFIDALMAILEKNEAVGEIFNIGNPAGTVTTYNLAKTIIALAESKSKMRFIPHIEVDIELRVPNIQKAGKLLGFRPKIELDDGIKKSIKWYRQNPIEDE